MKNARRFNGSKYDPALDVKEIAARIRGEIKAEVKAGRLPKGKYGVKIKRYSGGQSIDVTIGRLKESKMAKKHVRSDDPRKPKIIAALKLRSGGNKVTLLTEEFHPLTGLSFTGNCLSKTPGGRSTGYDRLGYFTVTAAEAGLGSYVRDDFVPATSSDPSPEEHDAIARRDQEAADAESRGWYHTGVDSFDNPQIKHFDRYPDDMAFGHGPFLTFQGAKRDFLRYLQTDIDIRTEMKALIRKMDRRSCE